MLVIGLHWHFLEYLIVYYLNANAQTVKARNIVGNKNLLKVDGN